MRHIQNNTIQCNTIQCGVIRQTLSRLRTLATDWWSTSTTAVKTRSAFWQSATAVGRRTWASPSRTCRPRCAWGSQCAPRGATSPSGSTTAPGQRASQPGTHGGRRGGTVHKWRHVHLLLPRSADSTANKNDVIYVSSYVGRRTILHLSATARLSWQIETTLIIIKLLFINYFIEKWLK